MTKKQIKALLKRRAVLAKELVSVEDKIAKYIHEHNLQDKVDDDDWLLGVAVFGSPTGSADRVIEIIEKEVLL